MLVVKVAVGVFLGLLFFEVAQFVFAAAAIGGLANSLPRLPISTFSGGGLGAAFTPAATVRAAGAGGIMSVPTQLPPDPGKTRLTITEATVRLHGSVGPARTTIKAIAAEAGVQRATVYRHFPDLESLFMACSAHWASWP